MANEENKWREANPEDKNSKDLITIGGTEIVPVEDESIEGEIVDELPDDLKNITKETKEGYDNQYALMQVYKNSIEEILNTCPTEEIPEQKQLEIIALLDEWETTSEEYSEKDEAKMPQKEKEEYKKFRNKLLTQLQKLKKNFNKLIKITKPIGTELNRGVRIFRSTIFNLLDDSLHLFDDILNAKLPKSLIAAIALSNPLTAIVYQNSDLLSNSIKGGIQAVKTITGHKGTK